MDNQDVNPPGSAQALICDVATGVCLPEGETAPPPAGKFTLPVQDDSTDVTE